MKKEEQDAELHEYRLTVERLAEAKSPESFSNGMPEHAAIIIETFLKFAKKRVVIFCKQLSSNVFGIPSITARLESALLKGIRVDIIVQEKPESDDLMQCINKWKENSKLCISLIAANGRTNSIKANFAVMDGEAYRYEPDNDRISAYACMFNPRIASSMEDTFYRIKAALN
jgi:hypothetical protein